MPTEYVLALGGVIVSVLGYLLSRKDLAQEKKIEELQTQHDKDLAGCTRQISTLWEKHDADARELEALKLLVASKHYERGELDSKFDKLENAIQAGLTALGAKLDKLTEVIIHNRGHT